MVAPTTYKGSSIALFIEDTANPGTYIRPCGLNDHSFNFTKNLNEVNVPDCDDPDLPAWVERETESVDFSGSGSGILAAEAVDQWWAAFANTSSILGRAYIGKPDNITNGRFWAGNFHITGFEVTGQRGQKALITTQFASDGELTFTNTV